jgi:hypothetical protein
MEETSESRFRCTPAGDVARGRRRLRLLLLGMAAAMVLLGIALALVTRWGPSVLCLATAAVCWFVWQMSGDLDPLWLELSPAELSVQMRRRRSTLALVGAAARRLSAEEREHLADLASASGVVFSSAAFESRRFGEIHLFATNLAHAVLLEADDPEEAGERLVWVVTPDDPESLLAALGLPEAAAAEGDVP